MSSVSSNGGPLSASSCDVNELPISSDTHSCPKVPKRGNTVFKTTTWSFIQICFRISGRF
jgi:hypothetical protein